LDAISCKKVHNVETRISLAVRKKLFAQENKLNVQQVDRWRMALNVSKEENAPKGSVFHIVKLKNFSLACATQNKTLAKGAAVKI
jgi:hypothetical protein